MESFVSSLSVFSELSGSIWKLVTLFFAGFPPVVLYSVRARKANQTLAKTFVFLVANFSFFTPKDLSPDNDIRIRDFIRTTKKSIIKSHNVHMSALRSLEEIRLCLLSNLWEFPFSDAQKRLFIRNIDKCNRIVRCDEPIQSEKHAFLKLVFKSTSFWGFLWIFVPLIYLLHDKLDLWIIFLSFVFSYVSAFLIILLALWIKIYYL